LSGFDLIYEWPDFGLLIIEEKKTIFCRMRRKLSTSTLLFSISFLSACDPICFIRRDTDHIQLEPDNECVQSAIKLIPEIKKLKYTTRNNNYTACGENTTYSYDYSESDQLHYAVFEYCKSQKGIVKYMHYWSGLGFGFVGGPNSTETNSIRDMMTKVEKSIETTCNIKGLSEELKKSDLKGN
jgi:hypothetical protein